VATEAQQLLAKELGSLVQRLRLWTPQRWAGVAEPWGSRADLARHLAQWCADRAAQNEGERQRPLPVLHPDLLLADQLAVTGDDLVRTHPTDALCADAVAHVLLHRQDLLGEEPPQSLGGLDAIRRGRQVCKP
jgi:hypothetical protein